VLEVEIVVEGEVEGVLEVGVVVVDV